MENQSNIHPFTEWAKCRLDEMDAALAVLETKVHGVEANARAKADAAIADMKKRRDAFKADAKETLETNAKEWRENRAKLEAEWAGFEDDVEAYWDSVGETAGGYEEVFKARVKAQKKAWNDTVAHVETAAKTFEAKQKTEVDEALEKAKHIAQTAGAKLDDFNNAGKTSWSALHAALTESRTAFDVANSKALAAFKDAAKA